MVTVAREKIFSCRVQCLGSNTVCGGIDLSGGERGINMTPLAMKFTNDLISADPKSKFYGSGDQKWDAPQPLSSQYLNGIHCFECSNVYDLIEDLYNQSIKDRYEEFDCDLIFLPSPKTWIEYRSPSGGRCAFLISDVNGEDADVFLFAEKELFALKMFRIPLKKGAVNVMNYSSPQHKMFYRMLYGCLSFINSPKLIGRLQHMPHRGLEKKLLNRRNIIGNFPLNAWTEIKLEICLTPEDMSTSGVHEAHLTGKRAYHFCRAHLRIRNGRLEFVKSHWRGDRALGTKRSRYRVLSPREIGGAQ